ncbi:MAG: superoxide dismutase family protein [Gemmatimonadaceae bacterium]
MPTTKHLLSLASLTALTALTVLGACSQSAKTSDSTSTANTTTVTTTATATAHAVVSDSAGKQVATATFTQDSAGNVHVQMHAQGLTPGEHGVHFHAVGTCTAPGFASAGGHFNPDSTKHHGLSNPAGPHAGDLPNMLVDSTGKADYTAVSSTVSLAPGAKSLFDADGSALVIHATADDNMSDPAGNAGSRVGCGVITSGPASA